MSRHDTGDSPVQVEPWVVLYAVRYGLGRGTGAYTDALDLVHENADALARWADQVVRDVKESMSRPHPFRGKDEHDRATALLDALARKGWTV